MNEELRAKLLERADRDQAARNSLPPDGTWEEWGRSSAPSMRPTPPGCWSSTVKDGVPELWTVRDPEGLDARRAALGLEPEHENRARLLARHADSGSDPDNTSASDS
jgi:hypothetical protein